MTAVFACLQLKFSVHAAVPALQRLIDDLYAPFAAEAAPEVHFSIHERRDDGEAVLEVSADDRRVCVSADPSVALAHLVWEINQAVIRRSSGGPFMLLHAAAAELDGQAVLLPAPSGRGKSTVVTGLLANGLGYLTDDIVPFDGARGLVCPYPKPISVSRWLWPLFPHLDRLPFEWYRFLGDDEWHLSARAFGAQIGRESAPRMIVAPHFSPGVKTRLRPLARAEAVQLLALQSFNLAEIGSTALEELARMVQGCRCFMLDYSELHDAVDLITDQLRSLTPTE